MSVGVSDKQGITVVDQSEAWPFDEPPNVAVFTSTFVIRGSEAVLYVSHDADDGAWQFHHGGVVSDEDAMIVALSTVLRQHPELAELADLPMGWKAERTAPGEPWIRAPKHEEEE